MNSRDQIAGAAVDTKGAPSRTHALMWWAAAAVVLAAGYADLWRGSESVAPILLVLGYCVLIPVAILK